MCFFSFVIAVSTSYSVLPLVLYGPASKPQLFFVSSSGGPKSVSELSALRIPDMRGFSLRFLSRRKEMYHAECVRRCFASDADIAFFFSFRRYPL